MKLYISAFIGFVLGCFVMFLIADKPNKETKQKEKELRLEQNLNLVLNSYSDYYVVDIERYSSYMKLHLHGELSDNNYYRGDCVWIKIPVDKYYFKLFKQVKQAIPKIE